MTIAKRNTFRRADRLKSSADFQRVFRTRISTANAWLVVYAMKNERAGSRLGISVGKRFGNAVTRNHFKRRIREAFRLTRHAIPAGYDWVVIPRLGVEPDVKNYSRALIELTNRLDNKWHRREENPAD